MRMRIATAALMLCSSSWAQTMNYPASPLIATQPAPQPAPQPALNNGGTAELDAAILNANRGALWILIAIGGMKSKVRWWQSQKSMRPLTLLERNEIESSLPMVRNLLFVAQGILNQLDAALANWTGADDAPVAVEANNCARIYTVYVGELEILVADLVALLS